MTILSKIETLIEYAKFGMFICNHQNNRQCELFFPRAISYYYCDYNSQRTGWFKTASAIKGHVKSLSGKGGLQVQAVTKMIDLPDLNTLRSDGVFSGGSVLQTCKVPSLRVIPAETFADDPVLEYVEVGKVINMVSNAFKNTTALKEFRTAEGTTSNLYLQYCEELTQECLHSIVENYADMTGGTSSILYIGETNIAKIDEEHIKMMQQKNISYK